MSAYYQLLNRTTVNNVTIAHYRSTIHAQGAWNPHEQHMAPASGIITAELEQFSPRSDMRIGRISFDILGLIHFGEFTITTQVIRGGKTIELVEAVLESNGRVCIVARVWRMMIQNTQSIAALEDQHIHHPESYAQWDGLQQYWAGGFIQTIEARANHDTRAGKGIVWLTNSLDMVEGNSTSDFVRLMGMVDTANGIVPRQEGKFSWAFPNLDLQIHLYRYPAGQWLGLETVQQYGADGVGLTSSVLHDIHGPFGRSEQILTLRPMP